jgi:hypothetical protein
MTWAGVAVQESCAVQEPSEVPCAGSEGEPQCLIISIMVVVLVWSSSCVAVQEHVLYRSPVRHHVLAVNQAAVWLLRRHGVCGVALSTCGCTGACAL